MLFKYLPLFSMKNILLLVIKKSLKNILLLVIKKSFIDELSALKDK
ncbi:hypothetical protein [Clostridium sp.]|nr:hypothetical protein [Clostridium sp.]MBP3916486.1 hypothetical protein [Clostridium sp.]